MGVDAVIFVLATHSSLDVGFVEHVFTLARDRDLWKPLQHEQRARSHRTWRSVQLPVGSHSNYGGVVPEGFEDLEAGHLQDDAYGGELTAFKGKYLAEVQRDEDGVFPGWNDTFNRAVFAFVAEHFPERDVVVYWC